MFKFKMSEWDDGNLKQRKICGSFGGRGGGSNIQDNESQGGGRGNSNGYGHEAWIGEGESEGRGGDRFLNRNADDGKNNHDDQPPANDKPRPTYKILVYTSRIQ